MASSSGSTAADTPSGLTVKVLSQLAGSDSTLLLTDLSAETTVADLKTSLSERLSSRPTSDHQRLIYRGRLLARDAETLNEVFGSEASQQNEIHIVHLVVRESTAARPLEHRHASVQPPQPPIAPAAAPVATNPPAPFSGPPLPDLHGATRVQVQTPFENIHGGAAPGHPQALAGFQPPGGFGHPIDIGAILQNQAQMMASMHHPGMTATGHLARPPVHQFGMQPGQHTAGPGLPVHGRSNQATPTAPDSTTWQTEGGQPNDQTHPNTRRTIGPNGGAISVTYTTTTSHGQPPMAFGNSSGSRHVHAPPHHHHNNGSQNTRIMSNWPNMPPLGLSNEFYGVAHAGDSMRLYQTDLERLMSRLRDHLTSEDIQRPQPALAQTFLAQAHSVIRYRNRAQQMVNDLLLPGRYTYHDGLDAEAVALLQNLNTAFTTLVSEFRSALEQVRTGRPGVGSGAQEPRLTTSQPTTRSATPVQSQAESSRPTVAYLLHSPAGPQAIVFDSHGSFSSSVPNRTAGGPQQSQPNPHHDPILQHLQTLAATHGLHRSPQERIDERVARAREAVTSLNRELASANEALTAANSAVTNMHHTNNAEAASRSARRQQGGDADARRAGDAPAQQPADQAPAQVQAVDGPNDLGQILFHTLWHLWTLVRLFAFIWLFTRGMSTRRTVMLIIGGLFYLAAQAGLFGDTFERLRRHFEDLLGMPQADPAPANPPPQRADNQEGADNRAQHRHERPDPQALADRLLHERRDQDRSWLASRLIPVERAIALFFASLYPGVGERHVQARERMLAEQRRRDEEAEARERGQVEDPASAEPTLRDAVAVSTETAETHGSGEGSSSAVQAQEGSSSLRERQTASHTSA